jgi:hydrogenase maturation protein HypF
MLPYSGLHEMLFDDVDEPAFVMTSANSPSEPIVTRNFDAVRRLGSRVNFFLFYNRSIAQRCDDSVVRVHGKKQIFIRRSRGYAPEPISLEWSSKKSFLGLGAEINATVCVLSQNKAFVSQHIGNAENLGTLSFLKDTVNHLIKLTTIKPNVIVCDLHPKFTTTGLAYDLGNSFGCPVLRVQHHYAHIGSLMGEHGSSEMLGIVCDGYGYGLDGAAWGGEIIYSDGQGFERVAHLQEQPMVGGDLAVRYPLRMVAGILHGTLDVENWLFSNSSRFPHGEAEVDVIIKRLKSGSTPKTSSCGRVLDAVSAILGICYKRTYEGEPAMKLESSAMNGKDVLALEPKFEGNTLETGTLVREVFYNRYKYPFADLACSAQSYLANGLAQLAMFEAEKLGIETIGFSGGVAYNRGIALTIKKTFEKHGFKFCTNNLVPPGDGGISFGQVVAANLSTP